MINKFQQGGKQDAIMQFVQGLALTLLIDPNLIIQIAQLNPDALKAAVQTYQQTQDMNQAALVFLLALQQGVQAARHGAKLNYIKFLKHQCAEDEELYYYKRGGSVDCGCKKKQIMQNGGKTDQSTIDKFKSSREKNNNKKEGWDKHGNYIVSKKGMNERKKLLDSNKNEEGQADPNKKKIPAKCGGSKIKLLKGGEVCPKCGKVHSAGMGCTVAKFKMHRLGGSLNGIPFYQDGGKNKKSINNYYLTDYSEPNILQKAKLNGKELTIKVNKGLQKGEDPITIQGNNYYLKGDSTLVKNNSIPYSFLQLRNAGINKKYNGGSLNGIFFKK